MSAAAPNAAAPNADGLSVDRVNVRTLAAMKRRGEPIVMLTAYDFPTAATLDEVGVDVILVGDSVAMVVAGRDSTLAATMDQMIYHAEMVARGANRAMVVVDLPFPEGQLSIDRTLDSAVRVLKETRATAVKLEGGAEQSERIAAMVTAGIPVMAHVGLRPQNIHVDGGYRKQKDVERLVADAVAAQDAGAFAVLVECVSEDVAAAIHDALSVPTIGIGAGRNVDGQVLVTHDVIGLTHGHVPTFVRRYGNVHNEIRSAAAAYAEDVRNGRFPP